MVFTVHWVHCFKCHYFGCFGVSALQQFLQVLAIIVAEDEPLGSTVSDALNHRCMVPSIRVDLTPCSTVNAPWNPQNSVNPDVTQWQSSEVQKKRNICAGQVEYHHLNLRIWPVTQRKALTWKHFSQNEEGGVICHKAGGKDQSCILLV